MLTSSEDSSHRPSELICAVRDSSYRCDAGSRRPHSPSTRLLAPSVVEAQALFLFPHPPLPLFLFTSLRKPSLIHSTLRVSPSLHASLHFSSAAACICAFVLAGSLECTVCFVWTDTADSLGQLRLSACGISHASPRSFPDKTVGHDIFDNTSQGSASVK